MSEPLRIEIIVHPPTHTGDVVHPVVAANDAAAERLDRDQLLRALQEAHARDHELVEQVRNATETNRQLSDQLRMKTIECDHFKQDSYLWGLVVAWYVETVEGGELSIAEPELKRFEGKMIEGSNTDGWVTVTVADRPERSDEADRG